MDRASLVATSVWPLDLSRSVGFGFGVVSFLEMEERVSRGVWDFVVDPGRLGLELLLATTVFGRGFLDSPAEEGLDLLEAVNFLGGIRVMLPFVFGFRDLTTGLGAWATFGFAFEGMDAGRTLTAGRGTRGGAGMTYAPRGTLP